MMPWWMSWATAAAAVFVGAGSVQIPHWRAQRRRRARILKAKDPIWAVAFALSLAGLERDQVAGIVARYSDAVRDVYRGR